MVTPASTPRHARTHEPTPARARAPTHARTPEDDHGPFYVERLTFSAFRGFTNLVDIEKKGITSKKTQKKAESEYRAQQWRGSNARYHQQVLMRLRSARDGAEHCACQWLRVPCDEVVRQCVARWTWSLLYVPMK